MMDRKLADGFRSPDAVYRSAPFWSWNEVMTPERVRQQIDAMKEGGFGGAFLHSRIGLVTPYLGRQWKEAVLAAVDHCKRNGMYAYLYDEDRWPSGFAGGIVTKNPRHRMWYLHVVRRNGKLSYEFLRSPKGGARYAAWFNGKGYLDTMSAESVASFISSTHEVYRQWCGREFGKTVPAIFTDEPNYCIGMTANPEKGEWLLPWTRGFARQFCARYGYDIRDRVADLVEERKGCEAVRYDYYRLLSELFVVNFGKQIHDWCEGAGIALTGHYLEEDTLRRQVAVIGEAMAFYEWMQWPGVDHLCRNINNPLTLKQCSSVAHQLGKERVLSELYGCSGQNFTRAEMKWIGDWHICLGVNLFCPHLYLYSLRGCRKKDYPPTISHHQPYWKHTKPLEDYFSRVNFLLSQGTPVADVLVVHPIETAWCLFAGPRLTRYDEKIASLTQSLLERQVEYDFGSEAIMERHASADDGVVRVGKMRYAAVVIPPALTLRASTVALLESFASSGGRVLACRQFPSLIEGRPAGRRLAALKKKCRLCETVEELADLLAESREVTVCDRDGKPVPRIHLIRRRLNGKTTALFLANTSLEETVKVRVTVPGKGKVAEADGFTGEIREIPVAKVADGKMTIDLEFPPVGSHLLLVEPGSPAAAKKPRDARWKETSVGGWQISPDRDNLLVLDFCRVRTGRRWSPLTFTAEVQEQLEKEGRRKKIALLFPFVVDRSFAGREVKLIVEQGERYHIRCNGREIPKKPAGCWLDEAFTILQIPAGVLKVGTNEIVLETVFVPPKKKGTLIFTPDGLEVENIFLAGNFSVRVRRTVSQAGGYFHRGFALCTERQILPGDINLQGYPFYAGGLVCDTALTVPDRKARRFLEFRPFHAITAEVIVNGKSAGTVCLPPYRCEVTDLLTPGENRIRVHLYSSLRNPLGPHHQSEPNPEGVGPESFRRGKGWLSRKWTDAYSTLPFGLGDVLLLEETRR